MPPLMLILYVNVLTAQIGAIDHLRTRHEHTVERRLAGERGQATTEYALVLLAAAMVALLVIGWASAGGGAAKISRLFNRVIDAVIDRV
jgi:Flp pilus assembly pilin Flp